MHPEESREAFRGRRLRVELEVVRMPLAEAIATVLEGRILDAKTALGLLLARDRASLPR